MKGSILHTIKFKVYIKDEMMDYLTGEFFNIQHSAINKYAYKFNIN